jgi:hypothetical protein
MARFKNVNIMPNVKPINPLKKDRSYISKRESMRMLINYYEGKSILDPHIDEIRSRLSWLYEEREKLLSNPLHEVTLNYSNKKKRPVERVNLSTNKVEKFASLKEAGRKTGIRYQRIWQLLNKYRKDSTGYQWRYSDKESV